METKEAIQVLEVVCANFNGNLKDHERIQTALHTIRTNLAKLEEPKELKNEHRAHNS